MKYENMFLCGKSVGCKSVRGSQNRFPYVFRAKSGDVFVKIVPFLRVLKVEIFKGSNENNFFYGATIGFLTEFVFEFFY